jgi:DNA helicase HerA-like ATPase
MVAKRKKIPGKKKKSKIPRYFGKGLLVLIKSPYYLGKSIYLLGKKTNKKIEEKKIKKKRDLILPRYDRFEILHREYGDYEEWEDTISKADSKIGVILGARGSGKTAFGIKLLENIYSKYKRKSYAIGFKEDEMPSWITAVENIEQLGNDSFVLIDEGGILFSSRESMSNANKFLSNLILIARHKNLSIIFISQNSSNIEVNILRQADFLVLKPSSLLQKNFERKIIQKIYDEAEEHFQRFKDKKGLTHIYSDEFKGFVVNPLPSFWRTSISKSFK